MRSPIDSNPDAVPVSPDESDHPEITRTLKARSLASVFWLTLQNVATAALLVAIPAILAHLLTPDDLGLLEIALAFFGVATLFMELGTGPAIIQRPTIDAAFLSTVFCVNMTTGVVFAVVLALGADGITRWLRMDPHLATILRWLGVTLLPMAAAIVPRELLARRLAYRRIAIADAIAGSAAAIAGFSLLSRGLHVALIAGFVTYGTLVTIVLSSSARWRPSAAPDLRTIVPLLRFSLSVSGSKMLENLSLQNDRFLIGRYLGAAAVGLFGLARTIVRVPLRYLLNVSDEVLLSGLASLQSDRAYARQYYLAALRTELAILGPAVVFAAVFAFEFSRLLFGPSWDRAAVIAQLLAFSAWRNITGHTTGSVLLSHGRPDLQLRWTICALLLSLTYFFVGRPWGIEGVVTATAILDMTGWTIRHTMANRLLDLTWGQFARALSPLWLAHAIFLVVMMAIRYAIVGFVPGAWERVALGLPLGLIAYLVILRVVMPGWLSTLRRGTVESVSHGLARPVIVPRA